MSLSVKSSGDVVNDRIDQSSIYIAAECGNDTHEFIGLIDKSKLAGKVTKLAREVGVPDDVQNTLVSIVVENQEENLKDLVLQILEPYDLKDEDPINTSQAVDTCGMELDHNLLQIISDNQNLLPDLTHLIELIQTAAEAGLNDAQSKELAQLVSRFSQLNFGNTDFIGLIGDFKYKGVASSSDNWKSLANGLMDKVNSQLAEVTFKNMGELIDNLTNGKVDVQLVKALVSSLIAVAKDIDNSALVKDDKKAQRPSLSSHIVSSDKPISGPINKNGLANKVTVDPQDVDNNMSTKQPEINVNIPENNITFTNSCNQIYNKEKPKAYVAIGVNDEQPSAIIPQRESNCSDRSIEPIGSTILTKQAETEVNTFENGINGNNIIDNPYKQTYNKGKPAAASVVTSANSKRPLEKSLQSEAKFTGREIEKLENLDNFTFPHTQEFSSNRVLAKDMDIIALVEDIKHGITSSTSAEHFIALAYMLNEKLSKLNKELAKVENFTSFPSLGPRNARNVNFIPFYSNWLKQVEQIYLRNLNLTI